ncbi:MAG TPA: adenylyltransferase/cytidyltransferase family protein [Thermoanaerobaculia bacterium]|nr:adenylyltransferase/cytidyltransferase family protein [Thermoanaerobaculia bacterium]
MNAPILTETELLRVANDERRQGKSIAFANGVFDVLHVGHVRYLQDASKQADLLIVGVNSDDSVRAIKGEGRPVTEEHERAELVAAIRGVSYVTIFHDSSPARLIAVLKPEVHCKGTDYTAETVPEREVVLAYGGRIAICGDAKEHSTTAILRRLRDEG